MQSGFLLPVIFVSEMSLSDEPLFAPCLMCMPIVVFLMDVCRMAVSRPLSMEMPFAMPLPSMTPPLR